MSHPPLQRFGLVEAAEGGVKLLFVVEDGGCHQEEGVVVCVHSGIDLSLQLLQQSLSENQWKHRYYGRSYNHILTVSLGCGDTGPAASLPAAQRQTTT